LNVRIGCNAVGLRSLPLEEALGRVARAGFRYVEVEGNLSWCSHADPWTDDPQAFRGAIERHGFAGVSALSSHRELLTDPDAVPDITQALRWASQAGIPIVITGEGRLPEDMSVEQGLDVVGAKLAQILPVAEEAKVVLAMEPHGSISLSPKGLARIMALASTPWLGVNFDTANPRRGDYVGTTRAGFEWKLNGSKHGDEVETLTSVAELVRHVHIKDVIGRQAVPLGAGEVDLKRCLEVLLAHGFDGVLSYQTEGEETPDKADEMMIQSRLYLEGLLEGIRVATPT
jgi:sugar phosphate isomerase/epimerase